MKTEPTFQWPLMKAGKFVAHTFPENVMQRYLDQLKKQSDDLLQGKIHTVASGGKMIHNIYIYIPIIPGYNYNLMTFTTTPPLGYPCELVVNLPGPITFQPQPVNIVDEDTLRKAIQDALDTPQVKEIIVRLHQYALAAVGRTDW